MACDIEPIPLSAGFCELRETVNEVVVSANESCSKIVSSGLRLQVIGTAADNDTVYNTTKFVEFSGTPTDPLSGYSLNRKYTVQANDEGKFMITGQAGLEGQSIAPTVLGLSIFVNNIEVKSTSMSVFPTSMQWRPQIIAILDLVATDYVEIVVSSVGGTGADAGVIGVQNSLNIFKLI